MIKSYYLAIKFAGGVSDYEDGGTFWRSGCGIISDRPLKSWQIKQR